MTTNTVPAPSSRSYQPSPVITPAIRAMQDVATLAKQLEYAVHKATRGGQRVPSADMLLALTETANALARELMLCAEAKAREERAA